MALPPSLYFRPLLLACLVVSCVVPGCAIREDEEQASSESQLAAPGGWSMPGDVQAAAQEQRVPYDGAPPWRGAAGCGGGILRGTRELGDHLKRAFPAVTSYGGYACRPNTANRSETSVHGTGRALDVFIPLDNGAADNGKGDPVANWLVRNANNIGVQLVIWDRTIWQANGRGARRYTGPHPHHDHIHLELNSEGGAGRTAFFNGGGIDVADAVVISWNKLDDYKYSLDIRKSDGTWIGPCLSVATLGTSTSASYRGACDRGDAVPKKDITAFRVYYSNNDVWENFVEAPFDGKTDKVSVQLPGGAGEGSNDGGTSTGEETGTKGESEKEEIPPADEDQTEPPASDDDDSMASPEEDGEDVIPSQPKTASSGCSATSGPPSERSLFFFAPLVALALFQRQRRRTRRSSAFSGES